MAYKIPPQPRAKENYPWHLNNRNKRGLSLDLNRPRRADPRTAGQVGGRVDRQHAAAARKKLKLRYEDVVQWNPRLIYADVTGYGDRDRTPIFQASTLRAYWARSGLLSLTRDAGATADAARRGERRPCDRRWFVFRIVTALYRASARERFIGDNIAPREGVWACGVAIQGALCDAKFFPLHDRQSPPNALMNVYRLPITIGS